MIEWTLFLQRPKLVILISVLLWTVEPLPLPIRAEFIGGGGGGELDLQVNFFMGNNFLII